MNRNFMLQGRVVTKGTLPIVRYKVEIYRESIEIGNILFTTFVTLFLGEVICTGHFIDGILNDISDFVLYLILDNETCKIKASRIAEHFSPENVLVVLERIVYV